MDHRSTCSSSNGDQEVRSTQITPNRDLVLNYLFRDEGIIATLNRGSFEIHEFLDTEDTFVVQCIVLLFAQAFVDGLTLP